MKLPSVLMVHNYYRSASPSGENRSFEDERDLLARAGHRVLTYVRRSDELEGSGALRRARAAAEAIWSPRSRRELRDLLVRERPGVAHFQNTFPLISPSAYAACRDAGVPVVQALRNYRFACLNGMLYRDGRPCEDCLGRTPWAGVRHACYRDDRAASAAMLGLVGGHRLAGTWGRAVDVFVAPSEFSRAKAIEAGLPADRIAIKPNFVHPDPGTGDHAGGYALFAGRLSAEKGVGTMLEAWEKLGGAGPPLRVAGDGPMAPAVREAAARIDAVEWLGAQDANEVGRLMSAAAFVVVPSRAYETFGRVIVEAFARGTPAIVGDIGAAAELVEDGRTGVRADPGDAGALADAVARLASDPALRERMGLEARAEYERRYTADANLRMLLDIYERAGAKVR